MRISGCGAVYCDSYRSEITADSYPVFRPLREEAPLYYNDEYDFYAVSRFDDVNAGEDYQTFIPGRNAVLGMIKQDIKFPPGLLISPDPTIYSVYCALLMRIFSPKRISKLEDKVRNYCTQSLHSLVGADRFDFIIHFVSELSVRVISVLLGIPEKDQVVIRDQESAALRTEPGKAMDYDESDFSGEGCPEYIDCRIGLITPNALSMKSKSVFA